MLARSARGSAVPAPDDMSDDLSINDALTIPGWELWVTTSRSSGAGGQHVNRTESRVTLHWNLVGSSVLDEATKARLRQRLSSRLTADGVLQVSAEDERSQHRNRADARERLAALIEKAHRKPRKRIATKPSRSAKKKRLQAKRHRGRIKAGRGKPGLED